MNTIKIIEQNINQNKKTIGKVYKDKLNDDNFYNGLKKENADIYIFNEVIEPQNIINNLESKCPNKYEFKYNETDLYYSVGKDGKEQNLQNKIMIIYDKKKLKCIYSSEELYSIDDGLDFLHVKLESKTNGKIYNIIGVRFYNIIDGKLRDLRKITKSKREKSGILKKLQESNKKPMNTLQKLMEYVNDFENVIIAGDFNNGVFNPNKTYEEYTNYNYHKIYEYINEGGKYKLLTKGIKENNGELEFDTTFWTHLKLIPDNLIGKIRECKPLDHYIISNSVEVKKNEVIVDKNIENLAYRVFDFKEINKEVQWGEPDHRKVLLEIAE